MALHPTAAGVPQNNVLGSYLYLLFTVDPPLLPSVTTAIFTNDTALLTSHGDYNIPTNYIQQATDSILE